MTPKPKHDPEHAPGERFRIDACRCTECGRLVTAEPSIARGCGPRCFEKRGGGREHQRATEAGQLGFPWEAGA